MVNRSKSKPQKSAGAGDRTLAVGKLSISVKSRRDSSVWRALSGKSTPDRSRKSSTFKRSDSKLNAQSSFVAESKMSSPLQKRFSCFANKRSKKVRVVSEAVAISRLQRWCRRLIIVRHLKVPGDIRDVVHQQKVRDEAFECIRARLAKLKLKCFFNSISSFSGSAGETQKNKRKLQHTKSSINLQTEAFSDHLQVLEAAVLAKKSTVEMLRRQEKNQRAAVKVIERKWTRTSLYKYLRYIGSNKLAQRIVVQQEIIERRDIIRRYYKEFIQMHQDCYNNPNVLECGHGTRKVPLYISLILFSSDCSLAEIIDEVKKPYGMGPYHPYSVEEIPEDFKTLRILERRFMFSKEERQILQQEGILDVNEPPRTPSMIFDPDFVFGSPIDYLRHGEFTTRLRHHHPSLQLGIRRTSSLILDRDFRIIGENGISEEGLVVKPLPSARSLRHNLVFLHQLMKRTGYVRMGDVDGSFEPFSTRGDILAVDPMDIGEDPRQRKLNNDLLLVLKPLSSNHLELSPHTTTLPLLQELFALTCCRDFPPPTSTLLIGMGDPVANAFFHPAVSIAGSGGRNAKEERGGKSGGAARHSKVTKHEPTSSKDGKMDPALLPKLFKFFSSTMALGPTWKAFMEENNFSSQPKDGSGSEYASTTLAMDAEFQNSIGGGCPNRSETMLFRTTLMGNIFPSFSLSQGCNSRKFKHLRMVLGDRDKRQELSLQHFLSASKRRENSLSGAEASPLPENRATPMEFQEVLDRTSTLTTPQNIILPSDNYLTSAIKPRVISPFIPDPSKIMYVDLQSEFERLTIRENVCRQQMFRRFMLIKESIEKMFIIEAERRKEFIRRLLDVEI